MASAIKRKVKSPKTGEIKTSWIVRHKDQSGSKRQETFKTKKEADAFAREISDRQAKGLTPQAGDIKTVKDACKYYMDHTEARQKDGRISYGTFINIQRSMKNHIIPNIGAMSLRDLRSAHVVELYNKLIDKSDLAPKTAKNQLIHFNQCTTLMQSREWLFRDPVGLALRELRGVTDTPVRTFTLDELGKLFTRLHSRAPWQAERALMRLRCYVHLAAFCGLRFGEISALTLENFDTKTRTIKIRHSITAQDLLKGPKTRSGIRDVMMPDHIAEIVSAYVARYYVDNRRNLIFRTESGKVFQCANFHSTDWKPLLKRAGLMDGGEVFHFHALRHFAVSWWMHNGMTAPEAAKLIGHSSFDMTLQRYAHPIVSGIGNFAAMQGMAARLLEHDRAPVALLASVPAKARDASGTHSPVSN